MQAIGEARILIGEDLAKPAAGDACTIDGPALGAPRPMLHRILPWAVAGLAIVIAALAAWAPWRPAGERPPTRLSVEIGTPASLDLTFGPAVIVSPGGNRIVFVARPKSDQRTQLYIRLRDQLQAVLLSGTEGGRNPFFSPDGEWIGFFADGKLKKIAVRGGTALTLCDAPQRLRWHLERGRHDNVRAQRPRLSMVSAGGGTPQPLTTLDRSQAEYTHRRPQVLPGGKAILFMARAETMNFDQANIVVQVLRTGERKIVHQGGMFPRYVPSGQLLYTHEGSLFVAPFDVARLKVTGPPSLFLEHVATNSGTGGAQFDFSKTGSFLYVSGENRSRNLVIDWMDREGKFQPLRAVPSAYFNPRLCPDGERLALDIQDRGARDIWVYDWHHDRLSRLTFGLGINRFPVWTPDGRRIVFA